MKIFKTKRVFFLALYNLMVFGVRAQSDFRPGFVVTLQGDTINGLINFRGDKGNTKSCIFKNEVNSKKVTYTPGQIKSYQFFEGKCYVSGVYMNFEVKEPIFLEYLIKGSVNIFYYQDDVKDHYFVVKDTTMIELDHHDRLTGNAEDDALILAKPEKYREQLKLLLQDQPSLFSYIDKIGCYKKDLVLMTQKYQNLSHPSQESIQYKQRTGGGVKFKFGILSSAGLSHLGSPPYNMYISDYDETKCLDFKPAFTYEIGATLNLYLDYTGRNKFCVQMSPVLNFVEYTSNEERTLSPLLYIYKLNVNYTTLKIPFLLKYSFYSSNRSVFPFVKFGPGCAIYLSQKGEYEYYSTPISGSTIQPKVYNKPLNHVSQSTRFYFAVGAGTNIKCGRRLLSIGALYASGEGQLVKEFRSDIQFQVEYEF